MYFEFEIHIPEIQDRYIALIDNYTNSDNLSEYSADFKEEKKLIHSLYSKVENDIKGLMNKYMH